MNQVDSATTTFGPVLVYPASTLSSGVLGYSRSTPVPLSPPTGIPIDFETLSSPTPASSASYDLRPPHIAIPTSQSVPAGTKLGTGAIVGIVLGALAFFIAIGGIVLYLRKSSCSETRKKKPKDSWTDLENTSDLDSLPPYDEVKVSEPGTSAHYTKYVPRTPGKLSPVSQTVPPIFDLIKEHHFASDLPTDFKAPPPRTGARQNTSPGYLNHIELTVTPFDARFDR